jgi:elongation factor 1-beta
LQPPAADDDDDDVDLFGEETEEEKAAAEARAAAVKASGKKKECMSTCMSFHSAPISFLDTMGKICTAPSIVERLKLFDTSNSNIVANLFLYLSAGKSSVLLDVKPWDDETDMAKLEAAVRNVKMDGLLWGACMLPYTA